MIKSKDNFQYSRAYIFSYGGPFWHTGAHANLVLKPDRAQAGLYLYNGWNTIYDTNHSKTIGGQFKLTPADVVLVYNVIAGPEQASNERNWRVVQDVNLSWNITNKVTLLTDFLYGRESGVTLINGESQTAQWWGGTLASKFQLHSKYYLSPRFEFYKDRDGYTLGSVPQTLHSETLTSSWMIADALEFRFELRHEKSTADLFYKADTLSSRRVSALVAALYSF